MNTPGSSTINREGTTFWAAAALVALVGMPTTLHAIEPGVREARSRVPAERLTPAPARNCLVYRFDSHDDGAGSVVAATVRNGCENTIAIDAQVSLFSSSYGDTRSLLDREHLGSGPTVVEAVVPSELGRRSCVEVKGMARMLDGSAAWMVFDEQCQLTSTPLARGGHPGRNHGYGGANAEDE